MAVPFADKLKELPLEHCQTCNEVLQSAQKLREFLAKCQECVGHVGVDLTDLIQQNEGHIEFARAVKRQFYPTLP